jgi:hypothetical protein
LVNGSRFLSVTSQQVKGRMEFNESYYTASGLLFYNSSAWIDKGDTTWVDRKRYDYDENGIMTKAVHEYFISAEHLVQRFINTTGKAIDINKGPERSKLKLEKIKAYEFWD